MKVSLKQFDLVQMDRFNHYSIIWVSCWTSCFSYFVSSCIMKQSDHNIRSWRVYSDVSFFRTDRTQWTTRPYGTNCKLKAIPYVSVWICVCVCVCVCTSHIFFSCIQGKPGAPGLQGPVGPKGERGERVSAQTETYPECNTAWTYCVNSDP